MDPTTIGLVAFAVVLGLLAVRIPIAFALGAVAVGATFLIFAFRTGQFLPERAIRATVSLVFSNSFDLVHSYDLSMIPLFIALGHVAWRAGITTEIYAAARVWLARVPGGVAIASVAGCGGFSAISGSSIACASTMGRICTPEMLRLGYDNRLATACVTAGGTLGSLIPPSVLFIIYGIFTETSISQLFLAGVVPGLLSLAGYVAVIWIWTLRNPAIAPVPDEVLPLRDKLRVAAQAWPALLLFVLIVGGIYGGFFTATEAAALSLLIATGVGLARRSFGLRDIVPMLRETAVNTAAIFLIAACAKIFVAFIALTGVSGGLVTAVGEAGLSQGMFLLLVVLVYLLLGMFLDPIGIMVLTLPLMVPMVESYGLNLIWFGVVTVKLLEIGLITPPVGLNVFVLAGVLDEHVPIGRIFVGLIRFLAMDLVVLALIVCIPALSLYVPATMF